MIAVYIEAKKDDEGNVYLLASGDIAPDNVNLMPGDSLAVTETVSGLTVDIGVRKAVEGPLPPTMDKVFDWLVAKGLDVGRHDALELIRILNGWDGPRPE